MITDNGKKRFEKVIGYDGVKEKLAIVLDAIVDKEKYKRLGVRVPRGILLDGKPGLGKTLFATEFIKESGLASFTIRKNKPDGDFIDYIRETFSEAEKNAPSIVFLDDMDKFANEDSFHCDAEEYVTIQACIDDTKDKEVFVIATTNDKDCLPESLLRSGRFDWKFTLYVPRDERSEDIIRHYLEDKPVENDIDAAEIARFARGYSCADLEKVVNNAGLYAVYQGRESISQEDLIQSCLRKFYGLDTEKKTVSESNQKRVALHEAGHVVVSEVMAAGSVDFSSICCYRNSRSGGLTSYKEDEDAGYCVEAFERKIMVSLGGRAATEIVLGETDMGTNRDLHSVFDNVRRLIDDHASYDFGSWCHGEETAQSVYESLDRATSVEVSRYYNKAKQILIGNRAFLDAVSEMLYDKKTISYKDIKNISNSLKTA